MKIFACGALLAIFYDNYIISILSDEFLQISPPLVLKSSKTRGAYLEGGACLEEFI